MEYNKFKKNIDMETQAVLLPDIDEEASEC